MSDKKTAGAEAFKDDELPESGGEGQADNVVVLGQEEGKGGKEDKKNKGEVNVELRWHGHLTSRSDFAVDVDQEGNPVLYQWEKNYWNPVVGSRDITAQVRRFILSQYKSQYGETLVRKCSSATESTVYTFGKRLEKENKRVIISTNGCLLEVMEDGRIGRINKQPMHKELYRVHVDVSLKYDQFTEDGFYITAKDEDIEGRGMFGKLICGAFPDLEVRRAFQEFYGDTLSPIMRKAFPVLLGPKDGGKSQVLECLMGLVSNSYGGDLSELDGFEMASYVGKSLIVIDELGKTINEKQFKRIIGGARISIRRKYLDTLSIRPDFKLIGGANDMPRFTEKSGAVESRIYPFPVETFKGEQIAEIAKKILEGYWDKDEKGNRVFVQPQMQDLMDWALNGLSRVMKRGRLLRHNELPKRSKHIHQEMREDSNPVLEWIRESGCRPSEGGSLVPKLEVYKLFCAWADEHGRTGLARISQNVWSRDMFMRGMREVYGDGFLDGFVKKGRPEKAVARVDCYAVHFDRLPDRQVPYIGVMEILAAAQDEAKDEAKEDISAAPEVLDCTIQKPKVNPVPVLETRGWKSETEWNGGGLVDVGDPGVIVYVKEDSEKGEA